MPDNNAAMLQLLQNAVSGQTGIPYRGAKNNILDIAGVPPQAQLPQSQGQPQQVTDLGEQEVINIPADFNQQRQEEQYSQPQINYYNPTPDMMVNVGEPANIDGDQGQPQQQPQGDESPYARDMSGYGMFLDALNRSSAESQGNQYQDRMARQLAGDSPQAIREGERRRMLDEVGVRGGGARTFLGQQNQANQLARALQSDASSSQRDYGNMLSQLLGAYTGQDIREDKLNVPPKGNSDLDLMKIYNQYQKNQIDATPEDFREEMFQVLGR